MRRLKNSSGNAGAVLYRKGTSSGRSVNGEASILEGK